MSRERAESFLLSRAMVGVFAFASRGQIELVSF